MVFPAEANWAMRIKIVRTMKNQTQKEVAELIGTTRKHFYLWETGKAVPRRYFRIRLAEWAGVPEEILFKGAKR